MVNGLGVLGWGVGGIEAEAAMLGQPVSMLIPEVVGFKLTGELPEGITATDLVLTVTADAARQGRGRPASSSSTAPACSALTLADRATIANMAPEYGATCGFFPIDDKTLDYLRLTGRPTKRVALVEAYAKAQGMWLPGRRRRSRCSPTRSSSTCRRSCRRSPGPKRPQDRVAARRRSTERVRTRDLHQEVHRARRRAARASPVEARRVTTSATATS